MRMTFSLIYEDIEEAYENDRIEDLTALLDDFLSDVNTMTFEGKLNISGRFDVHIDGGKCKESKNALITFNDRARLFVFKGDTVVITKRGAHYGAELEVC